MEPIEIAAYAKLFLDGARVEGPSLHLIASPGEERDAIVKHLLEAFGGGHFLTPQRNPASPLSLEIVLDLLRRKSALAIEDVHSLAGVGIVVEGVRREAVDRGGILIAVTDDLSDGQGYTTSADPRGIVRFEVRAGELRVATAADWHRGQIRIPRDGGKPRFVGSDRDLAAGVQKIAHGIIDDAMDG